MSDDSDAIAKDLASDCRSFVPADLDRETRPCKTGYLEVAFLRARSLWRLTAAATRQFSAGGSHADSQDRQTGADVI